MNEIEKGSCKGRVLYLDCYSGLSGDMILSALIDLGVPLEVVKNAAGALEIEGYEIRVEREKRGSIDVTRFFVDVDEANQPHRHFVDIKKMIEDSSLAQEVKSMSVDIFECLAKAEARVHGSTIEKIHFHEVGAVDSIVDIVGAAAAICYLGADVVCRQVPLGTGFVKTQHGALPIPAPATLFLLEGVPVEGTGVEAELTTPTGAAIVKTVCSDFGQLPKMVIEKVGFGAGARCHEERTGILRAILGKPTDERAGQSCSLIEANIDDVTGEIVGNAMERLFEAGCLDAWVETIQMKKARPAFKISILCKRDDVLRLGAMLMNETTTIGLRYMDVGRMEMDRQIHTVKTEWGEVRVKVAKGPFGSANAAPEFEDCKKIALESKVPLKRVMSVASGLAQKILDKE